MNNFDVTYQIQILPLLFNRFKCVRKLYRGYWVKFARDEYWVPYHEKEMPDPQHMISIGFEVEYYGDRGY